MISFRRVSNPMQTNASEKKSCENVFAKEVSTSFDLAKSGNTSPLWHKLNTNDAATKPMMNLGNFSHTIPNEGFYDLPSSPLVER